MFSELQFLKKFTFSSDDEQGLIPYSILSDKVIIMVFKTDNYYFNPEK